MLVKRKTTHAICANCGFKVEVRHHSQAACEKQRRVAELRGCGMTNAQVGRELGISRERVRQILSKIEQKGTIETIAAIVVVRAHQLGKEISLSQVIESLRQTDLNLRARSIVERAIGGPLMSKAQADKEVVISKISKLPDGRFTLSTEPGRALSETDLREELNLKHPFAIVEDIIRRVKQLP